MAWRLRNNNILHNNFDPFFHDHDLISLPAPIRGRDVYFPRVRDLRITPFRPRTRSRHRRHERSRSRSRSQSPRNRVELLREPSRKRTGDLGWSLDYATAWCFKHLVHNRTDVVDAVDKVRELPGVTPKTPFIIFDHLDRALFNKKLDGMVHLRWRSLASCSPGTTSGATVVPGVGRVCVELNKALFEDGSGDVDDLLDSLIHLMIHAFFLVACGQQPKDVPQDGRLMDGLHFGVILLTIRDITRQCQDGKLHLTFYAADRKKLPGSSRAPKDPYSAALDAALGRTGGRNYIAHDPKGNAVARAPADGQSHCNHDNRCIRPAQLRNWQVEEYSRAIDLDLEAKGNTIYELDPSDRLIKGQRLKGPPSTSYIELIWDGKRVIVPRRKALGFASIKKIIEKDEKYELKVPECSIHVFRLIHDFFHHKRFRRCLPFTTPFNDADLTDVSSLTEDAPPYFLRPNDPPSGLVNQIKAFKTAEALSFDELQRYILTFIHETPSGTDDPMALLQELYNDCEKGRAIHAEMHRWARSFLKQCDNVSPGWYSYMPEGKGPYYSSGGGGGGATNYAKIWTQHLDKVTQLYYTNPAFKDDCKIVVAEMTSGVDERSGLLPEHLAWQPTAPIVWDSPCALTSARRAIRRAKSERLLEACRDDLLREQLYGRPLSRAKTVEDMAFHRRSLLDFSRARVPLALRGSEMLRPLTPFAYDQGIYSI